MFPALAKPTISHLHECTMKSRWQNTARVGVNIQQSVKVFFSLSFPHSVCLRLPVFMLHMLGPNPLSESDHHVMKAATAWEMEAADLDCLTWSENVFCKICVFVRAKGPLHYKWEQIIKNQQIHSFSTRIKTKIKRPAAACPAELRGKHEWAVSVGK